MCYRCTPIFHFLRDLFPHFSVAVKSTGTADSVRLYEYLGELWVADVGLQLLQCGRSQLGHVDRRLAGRRLLARRLHSQLARSTAALPAAAAAVRVLDVESRQRDLSARHVFVTQRMQSPLSEINRTKWTTLVAQCSRGNRTN